jgi:hypothetical protein
MIFIVTRYDKTVNRAVLILYVLKVTKCGIRGRILDLPGVLGAYDFIFEDR